MNFILLHLNRCSRISGPEDGAAAAAAAAPINLHPLHVSPPSAPPPPPSLTWMRRAQHEGEVGKKIKEADLFREWGSCSTSLASFLAVLSSFCSPKLFLSLFFVFWDWLPSGTRPDQEICRPHLLGEILLKTFLRSSALIHRHLQQTTVELQSQ